MNANNKKCEVDKFNANENVSILNINLKIIQNTNMYVWVSCDVWLVWMLKRLSTLLDWRRVNDRVHVYVYERICNFSIREFAKKKIYLQKHILVVKQKYMWFTKNVKSPIRVKQIQMNVDSTIPTKYHKIHTYINKFNCYCRLTCIEVSFSNEIRSNIVLRMCIHPNY